MEHRKVSTILIIAGALAAAGGAALMLGFAPAGMAQVRAGYPALAWLFWPGLLFIWLVGGLCAGALWQYFRISLRIGAGKSFCQANARDMARIARLLFDAAGLVLAASAALLLFGLGPIWLSLLLISMAIGAMGLLAYALSRLLSRAVQLQEESDLTV